jgi:AbrB family looped-hinge helix DNA binding protein
LTAGLPNSLTGLLQKRAWPQKCGTLAIWPTFPLTPTRDRYRLTLGTRGRLVLPAPVRNRLDLREGDQLVLAIEADETMRLSSPRSQGEQLEGTYRDVAPRRSLADELIVERRRDASRVWRRARRDLVYLALTKRLRLPVLATDRTWADSPLGLDIQVIR